jgi:Na+-translocating ferredoxin:NAD+ oxidoreductase RnfD subunit
MADGERDEQRTALIAGVALLERPQDVAPVEQHGRAVRIGRQSYPVVLPKLRDPRLHVASVVITLHVLGQVGLHFRVSVPQILAAILTSAIIGMIITFRSTRTIAWPASAMLTGSGIGLILRVPGTPNDHWTFHAWWMFSGVAALSLLTKQIRYQGSHLFNPSNLGLVITFLVLGSTRVEPLDFWWAPLTRSMVIAYAVILIGGLLITWRLRLLIAAAIFYGALAVGMGLTASSGHCITARWAFSPVCGFDLFRVIMTSPEVLIFLFFMITDPKTVPRGRVGRMVFGLLVATVSVLLMAPQTTEFATKVALLGGLVLVCAFRPILDRLVPTPGTDEDHLGAFLVSLVRGRDGRRTVLGGLGRMAIIGAACCAIGAGIVTAGASAGGRLSEENDTIVGRVPTDVNPATFPTISIDQGVLDWNHEISGAGAKQIVLTLAENLELENQALLRDDPSILTSVDHGDRLADLQGRMTDARATGVTVIHRYTIDTVHVTLLVPFGKQDGLSLGLESRGTVTNETYDSAGHMNSKSSAPFATTFVMRRATGARWLDVAELPLRS